MLCVPFRPRWVIALVLFAAPVLFGQTCPVVNFYSGQSLDSYNQGLTLGFVNVMGGYTGYAAASDGSGTTAMPQLLALLKPCYANPNHKDPPADSPGAPNAIQPGQLVAIGDTTGKGGFGAVFASGFINGTDVIGYQLNTSTLQVASQNYSINGYLGDAVVLADFNGDQNPDIGVLTLIPGAGNTESTSSLVLLFGNGDGTFQPPVYLPVDIEVGGLTAADLNGDGHTDLILSGASAEVWLSKNDGTFQAPITIGAAAGQSALNASTAAVGDVNNDGKPDLVFGTSAGLAVALGSGSGAFQTPVLSGPAGVNTASGYVVLGDFNHDGILDAAATSGQVGIQAWIGKGNGKFTLSSVYSDADPPWSLVLADIDGDGNLDILSATGSALAFSGVTNTGVTLTVLYGNGDGTFLGLPVTPLSLPLGVQQIGLAAGDFNGDGKLDVVVSGSTEIQFFAGGASQFTAGPAINTNLSLDGIAAGDFNGDKKLDLAVATDTGVTLLNGAGNGTFTPGASFPLPSIPSGIVAGDFNGDGKPDLVTFAHNTTIENGLNTPEIAVLLNQGSGVFASAVTYPFPDPIGVTLGDFNGDGHTDLAVVSAIVSNPDGSVMTPASVSILTGNGDGSFQSAQAVPNTSTAIGAASGDFNGDGKSDLVVLSKAFESGSWSSQIFLGSSTGAMEPGAMLTNGFGPETPVVADFNNDGKLDLLIPYCCGQGLSAAIRLGNGDGTFGPEIPYGNLNSLKAAVAGDFNGDGKTDVAAYIQGGIVLAINASQKQGALSAVSAAGFATAPIAPGSIAALFGSGLATSTTSAPSTPLPAMLNGTSASITDSTGASNSVPLFFVSPSQVNAYIPPAVATGPATITVNAGNGALSSGTVQIADLAPGIFLLNSSGLAAAQGIRVVNNQNVYFPIFMTAADGSIVPAPIDLSQGTVYLVLYTTGVRNETTLSQVTATVGGVNAPVLFSGAQSGYVGLDQVNLQLPTSLAGKGNVEVQLTVGGIKANVVNVTIQ